MNFTLLMTGESIGGCRLDIDDRLSVAAVLNIKCPKRMWLFSDITTGESTACNWIVLGGGFSCIFGNHLFGRINTLATILDLRMTQKVLVVVD